MLLTRLVATAEGAGLNQLTMLVLFQRINGSQKTCQLMLTCWMSGVLVVTEEVTRAPGDVHDVPGRRFKVKTVS